MTAADTVNRIFREFKRYTGDGLPGEPTGAELPIGDPQSGVHNPKKSDLRVALLAPLTELDDAVTAAEAAQDIAVAAADAAEAAVSSVSVTSFPTKSSAMAYAPTVGPTYLRIEGYTAAGDGGGALYKKVVSEPSHEGKFSITLDDTVTIVWYELAEAEPTPFMVGAVGDGATDDTAALIRFATLAGTVSRSLDFGSGTYLVSRLGFSDFSDPFGNSIFRAESVHGLTLKGSHARFVCDDHDISTYGGLIVFWLQNCNGTTIRGFDFEMSFTGAKNSASFYPFCGAIIALDETQDTDQDSASITGNVLVEDCTFKLFHPWGCWSTSQNPYLGDPNNGYKLFTVFLSGQMSAQNFENQGGNVTLRNLTLKRGHNGYGFWADAFNNTTYENLYAEDYVTKVGDYLGDITTQEGIPFIRHHMFYTSGVVIRGCKFRAKPSSERLTAGFEGGATFCHISTNLGGDLRFGRTVITGNTVVLGNGDAASSMQDFGPCIYSSGVYIISDNAFDGHPGDTGNEYGSSGILFSVAQGQGGYASLVVSDNSFGAGLEYCENIRIYTGANSPLTLADRKLKQLTVTGNTSMAGWTFLNMVNFLDLLGVESIVIKDNIMDGAISVYDMSSDNHKAITFNAEASTDRVVSGGNIIRNYKWGFFAVDAHVDALPSTTTDTFVSVTNTKNW